MGIEMRDGGTVTATGPDAIRYFQLAAVKWALSLEILGMKRRGKSVRSMWAKHYGLPPRTRAEVVRERVVAEMAELLARRPS